MGWFRKDEEGPLAGLSGDSPSYQPAPAARPLPPGDAVLVEATAPGPKKIQLIKLHREQTGMGLRESKDAVETPPTSFGLHAPADAARLHDELVGFGATVRLEPQGNAPANQPKLDYLTDLLDRGVVAPEAYAAERARLLG